MTTSSHAYVPMTAALQDADAASLTARRAGARRWPQIRQSPLLYFVGQTHRSRVSCMQVSLTGLRRLVLVALNGWSAEVEALAAATPQGGPVHPAEGPPSPEVIEMDVTDE